MINNNHRKIEKIIKEFILKDFNSLDKRLFDTAYNSVNIGELDFVIENCTNKILQDYAIVKKYFFNNKMKVR